MPIVLTLERLRQKNYHGVKDNLSYRVRLCLKNISK